jgi:hypothetical protein
MTEEDIIQQSIVIWFKNNYVIHKKGLIFSVPNGGLRNKITAKILKLTGSLAGVSDLIVVQQNKITFVEVKTEKGVQSDSQKLFQELVEYFGFEYFIVKNLEQFKLIL